MDPVVQIALDLVDLEEALKMADQAAEGGVDWIEAGTPLIKSEGLISVERLKERFPDKKIVADMKTMDTGELEVELAGRAGADIVSVLGASADETVRGAVRAAEDHDLSILADLIAVREPSIRAKEVEDLGVDYVGIHAGIDQGGAGIDLLEQLGKVVGSIDIPIAVAGGLNAETASKAIKAGARIVVVGSAITKSEKPVEVALEIVRSVGA